MNNPKNYINREFSWLEFNERVLYEAIEKNNLLLERLKFLAIVSSNLEEFFMVRVAVLKKQNEVEVGESVDALSPSEQLSIIRERVTKMITKQYDVFYHDIKKLLAIEGVRILTQMEDIQNFKDELSEFFDNEILPLLTPISVGPTNPFPNLVSGRLYLAVDLSASAENNFVEKSNLSFVEIPMNLYGRFLSIGNNDAYIPIENVIRFFIDRIYGGYNVLSSYVIRITRDADFSIQEDGASDLLKEIESTIKRMHRRSVVKVEYEKGLPPHIMATLKEKYHIVDNDFYEIDGLLNFKDFFEIVEKANREDLKNKLMTPIYPSEFKGRDIFELIASKDILLFHPYHSYEPVVELINKAADDPKVLAIKQTLYRTSSNSSIIHALVRAAEKGKYVSVVDELKARFDEKRNIEWARRLEEAGAHVTYGVAGLKTHAKALLIVRKEPRGIKRYIHLGTGNYNESTARLYTDISFFTSDDKIGEDVSSVFNLLTGFSLSKDWNYLTMAPLDIRNRLYSLIRRETENAEKGLKARIIAKMNSLSDKDIIMALYAASKAGVKIRLIVRGICCLVPGIKGLSDNITVESLVGRFLEHSRIFYFYNNGDSEYYCASCDWMMRNLDRRVELLFPIRDKDSRNFIDHILQMQFDDNENTWILNSDKTYTHTKEEKQKNSKKMDSFEEIHKFIKNMEDNKKKNIPLEFKPLKHPDDEEE